MSELRCRSQAVVIAALLMTTVGLCGEPAPAAGAGDGEQARLIPEDRLRSNMEAVNRFGGSEATEKTVGAALGWLVRHQKADGSWEGRIPAIYDASARPGEMTPEAKARLAGLVNQLGDDDYWNRERASSALSASGPAARSFVEDGLKSPDAEVRQRCERILEHLSEAHEIPAVGNVGCTALALLALVGSGSTARQGAYADNVRHAQTWLMTQQRDDGSFGSGAEHAMAGLALAEAYGTGRGSKVGRAAQLAVEYSIKQCQVTYSGWGAAPRGRPELSTTAWFIMQMRSAKVAGLRVDCASLHGGAYFLDSVTSRAGLCSVESGRRPSPVMTAAGLWCRTHLGYGPENSLVLKSAYYLAANPPKGKPAGKIEHWFFATSALYKVGGRYWKDWNEALKPALIDTQARGGPLDGSGKDVAGSWESVEGADAAGSRVYATALGALCLETYYRNLPLWRGVIGAF